MGKNTIDAIQVTPLARIQVAGGDVMHAMKAGDAGFHGFGEAYFSWVEKGAVKAWKQHRRMTLNLVVPVGQVRFVFFKEIFERTEGQDQEPGAGFREEIIGDSRYARLTVPPGIWFGFQGLAHPCNLLLNLADMAHNPDECVNKERTRIDFDWNN